MTELQSRVFAILRPVAARVWLLTRGMTLGVRGIVLDDERGVLLIRHGYTAGWHFPGGGVEVGETLQLSLARELAEEANVVVTGTPRLHGVFHQPLFSRRDHVAVFVVREFTWGGAHPPNREIAECRFFPVDALPADVSPGTARRLREVLDGVVVTERW
jgi:8-oxo-dGTP pyrophosphatase MutT (NUDIX family)